MATSHHPPELVFQTLARKRLDGIGGMVGRCTLVTYRKVSVVVMIFPRSDGNQLGVYSILNSDGCRWIAMCLQIVFPSFDLTSCISNDISLNHNVSQLHVVKYHWNPIEIQLRSYQSSMKITWKNHTETTKSEDPMEQILTFPVSTTPSSPFQRFIACGAQPAAALSSGLGDVNCFDGTFTGWRDFNGDLNGTLLSFGWETLSSSKLLPI